MDYLTEARRIISTDPAILMSGPEWRRLVAELVEMIDATENALSICRDFAERYTQFASIHDDGEERLYAAQLERTLKGLMEEPRK